MSRPESYDPWRLIRELEEPGPPADRVDVEKLLRLCGFRCTTKYATHVYHHDAHNITFTFGEGQRDIPKPYLDDIVEKIRWILEQGGDS